MKMFSVCQHDSRKTTSMLLIHWRTPIDYVYVIPYVYITKGLSLS
jgi:hypothetical protein